MAKTKVELLDEAKQLGKEVDGKATVSEIKALIDDASSQVEKAGSQEEAVPDTAAEANPATEPENGPQTAKAGKRSAKALKEAEEKQTKEERKASGEADGTDGKPKKPVKPTRSRLERRAKGYRGSAEHIEQGKVYAPKEAVELAKKTSHVKFDATVELHIRLGVDPRQADQNIRDNLVLPAGTGKQVAAGRATKVFAYNGLRKPAPTCRVPMICWQRWKRARSTSTS